MLLCLPPAVFEELFIRVENVQCVAVCVFPTDFKVFNNFNFNKHVIQTCALHSLFIHLGGAWRWRRRRGGERRLHSGSASHTITVT